MKKILIVILLTFKICLPMDTEAALTAPTDVEKGVLQLEKFYDKDKKILDLRNLSMRDKGLKNTFPYIKKFINLLGVESLILEKNSLRTIPYYIITFALINRSLRYVSMKDNKFSIRLMLDQEEIEYLSIPLKIIDKATLRKLPEDMSNAIGRLRSDSKPSDLSAIASGIWAGISPEIEKALLEHNSGQKNKTLYKKIIIIDKNLPPITIIDTERVPKSKITHIKDAAFKLLLILIGVTISLIPQITEWLTPDDSSTTEPIIL